MHLVPGRKVCVFSPSQKFLFMLLASASAPEWLQRALRSLYAPLSAQFRCDGVLSRKFLVEKGLRRGCVLSGLLFAWDKPLIRPHSGLGGFADDMVLVVFLLSG